MQNELSVRMCKWSCVFSCLSDTVITDTSALFIVSFWLRFDVNVCDDVRSRVDYSRS